MCNTPCTTNTRANAAAPSTTIPMEPIFASMISPGVTGIASKCSIVPCSRSRINAAPARMIETSAACCHDLHQRPEPGSLQVRIEPGSQSHLHRRTGGTAATTTTLSPTSAISIVTNVPAAGKRLAHAGGIHVQLERRRMPRQHVALKSGGISKTKV